MFPNEVLVHVHAQAGAVGDVDPAFLCPLFLWPAREVERADAVEVVRPNSEQRVAENQIVECEDVIVVATLAACVAATTARGQRVVDGSRVSAARGVSTATSPRVVKIARVTPSRYRNRGQARRSVLYS